MSQHGFAIKPLTGSIGAEIEGVQLGESKSEEVVAGLCDALYRHGVIFFRDQKLTPQQQVDFAEMIGPIVKPVVEVHEAPAPGITVLDQTDPAGVSDIWHSDQSYMPRPPVASMLHAIMIPPVGGDTLWASTTAAYEALSEPMKVLLKDLSATHSTDRLLPRMERTGKKQGIALSMQATAAVHPIVRIHPATGRRYLYVNPLYTTEINELEKGESDAILAFLFNHIQSPPFQVRFNWRPNSVALWDQRSTIHYAVADYRERRVMHRLMIDEAPGSPKPIQD